MEQKWSNQSIRTQILALTALGVAGLLAVMVTAIIQMNHALDAAIAAIAAKVQAEVETAYSILQRYASEEAAGHLTRDQAQQRAKDTLRTMRYDGNNYFFVIDVTPRMVWLPFKPELEGQDVGNFKDATGFKLYVAAAALVKDHGEGQVGYHWPKPGTDTVVPKLSYVKGFMPGAGS